MKKKRCHFFAIFSLGKTASRSPMRSIRVACALMLLAGHAHSLQMSIPGLFAVNQSGAATYTLPIQVPPGIAGMEPKLALAYSSQSGNGFLGKGWHLTGLSSITRCAQTPGQDATVTTTSIGYTSADRFCLDGQRLISVPQPNATGTYVGTGGTYGGDQVYYVTENQNFSKIQSIGTSGSSPYAGPSSFKVWTKSGLVMEYGATGDSQVMVVGKSAVRVWALSKVTDTTGNYMSITYNTPDKVNGQFYPASIVYTGNAATSPVTQPTNAVFFDYDFARSDVSSAYEGGSAVKTTARLTKISTYAGSAVQSTATSSSANSLVYGLTYKSSNAGVSLISQISLCSAGVGAVCLPNTVFTWGDASNPNYAWTRSTSSWSSGGVNYSDYINATGTNVITGDFDGDGKTDFLLQNPAWSTTPIFLSNGDGTWRITNTQISSNSINATALINASGTVVVARDFDGDGKTDLLLQNSAWSTTPILISQGGGAWNVSNNAIVYGTNYSTLINASGTKIISADFNGDGRADVLLQNSAWSTTPLLLSSAANTWIASNNSIMMGGTNASAWINTSGANLVPGNFVGGGRASFILQYPWVSIASIYTTTPFFAMRGDGGWDVSNNTISCGPSVNMSASMNKAPNPQLDGSSKILTGDFNGDGLTDLVYVGNMGTGTTPLLLSQGDGTFQCINQALPNGLSDALSNSGSTTTTNVAVAGDFDGDGKFELTYYKQDLSVTGDLYPGVISYGAGSGWSYKSSPYTPGYSGPLQSSSGTAHSFGVFWGNFEGNGKFSSFRRSPVNTGVANPPPHSNTDFYTYGGDHDERIIAISDGLTSTVSSISYALVNKALSTRYTMTAASAYPKVVMAPSWPVVTDYTVTDGAGSSRSYSYWYDSATVEMGSGRGFLGFSWVQSQDKQTSLVTRTSYRQDFPYTGQVSSVGKGTDTANWSKLGQTQYQYSCVNFISTGPQACQSTPTSCAVSPGQTYFVYPSVIDSTGNKDLTSTGQASTAGLPGRHFLQGMDNWGNVVCSVDQALDPATGGTTDFSKSVTNVYAPPDTSNWFLGRLLRSTVTATAH